MVNTSEKKRRVETILVPKTQAINQANGEQRHPGILHPKGRCQSWEEWQSRRTFIDMERVGSTLLYFLFPNSIRKPPGVR